MNADEGKETLEAIGPLPDVKNILYVGACSKTFTDEFKGYWILDQFPDAQFTIYEVFPPLIPILKSNPYIQARNISVVCADIRLFTNDTFDLSIWWHGPEHLERKEVDAALARLERISRRAVIIGCPLGNQPQEAFVDGEAGLNPHEKHRCGLMPEDFEKLGFTTRVISREHKGELPAISAWKIL